LQRHKVGAEFLAVQPYIQKPVVFLLFVVGKRVVDEVVAREVVRRQQFLYGEVVSARERDYPNIRQFQFVYLFGKLAVLVVPEDDAAFVKFGQRRGEPVRESLFYRF
jgi:hypothetical protein